MAIDNPINDDFGDDLEPQDMTDLESVPVKIPAPIELPDPDELPPGRLAAGGAYVRPTGQQARNLAAGGTTVPPIVMGKLGATIAEVMQNLRAAYEGEVTEDATEPDKWPAREETERNLTDLAALLVAAGWAKNPYRVDQYVSVHGVVCEMGYTHGEVWVRAYAPRTHERHGKPVWTQRIYGYGKAASYQTLRTIFRDLADLEGVYSRRQGSGVLETVPLRPLGFALLTPLAKLPTRTYADDAGFDLYVVEDTIIPAGAFVDVPLGVSVGLPLGVWGRITGRSSTLRTYNLLVNEGIIDTGYTGPLFAGVRNLSDAPVVVAAEARIAQLILHTNTTLNYQAIEVDGHADTARGVKGFGSSGT